jgi:tripartite-type tricarboxylate transporter receptor subunit TctC
MKNFYQKLFCMIIFILSLNVAVAQSVWPSKPIRIIVPFAAGGNTDLVARITAVRLSQILGQPVLVENKAGSGGMIATDLVAKSPPDGYTLLMSSTGPHTILPSLMKKIPYNSLTDLAPVSNISSNALVLLVNPKLPVNNVSELIALAKKEPGKISFSSAGIGATTHLSGEVFKSMSGIDIVHVPYRGGAPATSAAFSGEVQITFANLSDALPQMNGGTLRAIAVTSAKRQPLAPNVPTIAESGLPGYEVIVWNGLVAPAKTPPEIINRLASAIQTITREPKFQVKIEEIGSNLIGDTPEQFSAFIDQEIKRWAKVVKVSGATLD